MDAGSFVVMAIYDSAHLSCPAADCSWSTRFDGPMEHGTILGKLLDAASLHVVERHGPEVTT